MPKEAVSQPSYYPQVECEARKGDADWEVVVAVRDEKGRRQFLSVSDGMVARENGKAYLAVGVVEVDARNRRVLIELPHEADSGVSRLWVPFEAFRPRSVVLEVGMRICQLIFEEVRGVPSKGYNGITFREQPDFGPAKRPRRRKG